MEFLKHLEKYLNKEEIEKLSKSFSDKPINALILNKEKISDETFLKLYPNIKKHPIVPHAYLFYKDEYDFGKNILFDQGAYYIQEPSAMLVAYLLSPEEDDFVLDLCAAPGGKTIGASLMMNNKGLIIANDISYERAKILSSNVERMGRSNIIVTSNDFENIAHHYYETFDKIILDAPCSGSGMFRKEEKMKDDWSYNKVLKYQDIQRKLLQIAFTMLKPGGVLSYSTCSYSYEEDEEIVNEFLKTHDASNIVLTSSNFYRTKDKIGIHLFPFLFPGEGHYIALIRKHGIHKKTIFKNNVNNIFKDDYSNSLQKVTYKNSVYGVSNLCKTSELSILRYGVKIGEFKGVNFIYDHNYSHYVSSSNSLPLNEKQKDDYVKGLELKLDNSKEGFQIVSYQNINIGLVKAKNHVCKNHYPKGLRRTK